MDEDVTRKDPAAPATPGAAPDPRTHADTPPATTTTPAATAQPSFGDRVRSWARKGVAALIAVVVAIIVYFILAAFLPRWWAGVIGRSVDGSFGRGIGTGLALGFICTAVPLILIGLAVLYRHRLKSVPSILLALVGIVVAIPNLLTLGVVLGSGNGAHAGQRIFDVDAPGFRASTLWGAIIGLLVAVAIAFFIWRFRRRGTELKRARGRERELARDDRTGT